MSARRELALAILRDLGARVHELRDERPPLRVLVTADGQDDLLLDDDPDYRFDVEDSDGGFRFRGIPLVRRPEPGPPFEVVWP